MPLYKRRPLIVEAHQMTVGRRDQEMLAHWCHGSLRGLSLSPSERSIKIPSQRGDIEAHPSDWIVKEIDESFHVYTDPYFELTHALTHRSGEER